MPAYFDPTANRLISFIKPGDSKTVWSAESPATGAASEAVALDPGRFEGEQRLSVEVSFSGDPGTTTISLQTADTCVDAAFVTEVSGAISNTDLNAGFYGRLELAVKARFARLIMTNDPSNSVTTTAKISR